MPNGKVDKAALPSPQLHFTKLEKGYVAPQDALQQQLVEIWEDLLKIHPISVIDNFFELGGHSLLAAMLVNRIKQKAALNIEISVTNLFIYPTVESLAIYIQSQIGTHRIQNDHSVINPRVTERNSAR